MPLLRRDQFVPSKPAPDLKAEDEVFVCEATKEVFKDYEEFFQRTILCNSLVWSCSITGETKNRTILLTKTVNICYIRP